MNKKTTCLFSTLIDQHFALRITSEAEQRLRAHLPQCASCRQQYDRYLLASRLNPNAPTAEERLGSALGFSTASRARRPVAATTGAVVAAACAALVFIFVTTSKPEEDDGFTSRGTASSPRTDLVVYHLPKGKQPIRVDKAIGASDEVAFAYANPTGKKYMLVFAVDDRDKVYWYYPAWTEPKHNPTAIPIKATPKLHELPEAIRHQYAGARLRVFGVFLNKALTVRQVEAAIKSGNLRLPDGLNPLIITHSLSIVR